LIEYCVIRVNANNIVSKEVKYFERKDYDSNDIYLFLLIYFNLIVIIKKENSTLKYS